VVCSASDVYNRVTHYTHYQHIAWVQQPKQHA
jgi:hypothetical protein